MHLVVLQLLLQSIATRMSEEIMVFDDFNNGTVDRMELNAAKDTIYITKTEVVRFSIDNPTVVETFFEKAGSAIYGLGVDPVNGDVYIGDGIDFAQKGLVYRVDSRKNEIDSFRVGVLPNGFLFK